ncbi:MAG: serine/threonine-protein kinase [Nannocystaceae bacterium]
MRRRIGRYDILQRLGYGGMATVYLARATGSAGFEKLVAIKVIHPHLAADPNLVEMFLDEARIAAQIHNPHVVEILDLGTDRGDYFMVMEFVDGETLSALIRKLRPKGERLPLAVILQILIDACEGLRAAHELRDADGHALGVIHRDVSPQNLLLDVDGWVRIVDFGIMKAKGKRTDTRTGQLRGKLPYMSPEQAQSKPLTPACDLFALGVILWELCTGERLFAGENDVETLRKVVACERPPLVDVRPDLPAALEGILARTLARDPNDRFASAAEMVRELRGLLREVDKGAGEPRAMLAAIMRERFGEQAEYRRATLRASRSGAGRPRISLVRGQDEVATRPDLTPSETEVEGDELLTEREAPVLTVVPAPADRGHGAPSPGFVPASSAAMSAAAAAEPTTGTVTNSLITGLSAAPSRGLGLWIVLPMVGALIAVLTLVATGLLRGGEDEAPAEPLAEVTPPPAETGAEPATAETIRWLINSDPDGAQVRITGAADPEVQASIDEQLAGRVTPLEVRLPRSEDEVLTIEVYLADYQAMTEKRLPLATDNLRYVLRAVADDADPVAAKSDGGKAKSIRLSAKTKAKATKRSEPSEGDDPLPAPTFDKPLKKRAPDGG